MIVRVVLFVPRVLCVVACAVIVVSAAMLLPLVRDPRPRR